jgi:flavin-dependent dehydrogenase
LVETGVPLECDVLIIGAGPAGLWAGRKAADAGFNVVILEEHLAIGLQKHCSGWILGCEFTRNFFDELKDVIPYQPVSGMIVRNPLSGHIIEDIEDSGWGGYLVRREFFDRELARRAIRSGAKLFLHTRAESFQKEDDHVVGVRTSSPSLPVIKARVTICADGMQSATSRGFARENVGTYDETATYPGVQMELAGVVNVTPGKIEMYEGDDMSLHGRSLWPHNHGITLASFSSIEAFKKLGSRDDNLFSRKIAPSFPIYTSSFQNRKNMGFYYSRFVQDGVMYIGEACGGSGVVHGMISANYAAHVAIASLRENNRYPERMEEYEAMMRKSDIYKTPFCYRHIRSHYGTYRNWVESSGNIKA